MTCVEGKGVNEGTRVCPVGEGEAHKCCFGLLMRLHLRVVPLRWSVSCGHLICTRLSAGTARTEQPLSRYTHRPRHTTADTRVDMYDVRVTVSVLRTSKPQALNAI
jgi:hypothetical protein